MTDMNFSMLLPELTALAVLVFMVGREIFAKPALAAPGIPANNDASWFTAVGGAFLTLASLFPLYGKTVAGFSGSLVLDPFALFFKTFFTLIVLVVIFMSREFFKQRPENSSEFLMILWSSLIGLFFLSSANDLLLLFVALETFALSVYVMAAYLKREMVSIEAGLKYLIMSSLASAFLIYGISLVFTVTGSTSLLALKDNFAVNPQSPLLLAGILLMICGLGFKIAAVPFQLWAPDVYQGAPTPVVAYLSTASKTAGFVLLLRLLFTAFPDSFTEDKRILLFSVLSVLTLFYGNLGALVQTDIKRLFGYSSISHAGYLLIGLAAGRKFGSAALIYYLIGYVVTGLAAFHIMTIMERKTGSTHLDSYRGLGKRSPFLAGMMFLALLSLAGVPPLAGFFGKFLVLMAAVRAEIMWLAFVGALLVAVSLYYYLNLVRIMYFDKPMEDSSIEVPGSGKMLLVILAAAIILIGFWQSPFYGLAEAAANSLF